MKFKTFDFEGRKIRFGFSDDQHPVVVAEDIRGKLGYTRVESLLDAVCSLDTAKHHAMRDKWYSDGRASGWESIHVVNIMDACDVALKQTSFSVVDLVKWMLEVVYPVLTSEDFKKWAKQPEVGSGVLADCEVWRHGMSITSRHVAVLFDVKHRRVVKCIEGYLDEARKSGIYTFPNVHTFEKVPDDTAYYMTVDGYCYLLDYMPNVDEISRSCSVEDINAHLHHGKELKTKREKSYDGIYSTFDDNAPLLDLLFKDKPPSPEKVIKIRNVVWDAGGKPDMNLFHNIMELAVRHEMFVREAATAD